VITELQQLIGAEPLRERLHTLLMLALYRCGQQAAALEAYRAARHLLAEHAGIEPGPELRQIHLRILQAAPDLMLPSPASAVPMARRPAEAAGDGR
jgi:DNA-binding SARP family transcriptional activator